VGCGHRGKGVLIHFLVDQQGNLLAASSTSFEGDEKKEVMKLLDKILLRRWINVLEDYLLLREVQRSACFTVKKMATI